MDSLDSIDNPIPVSAIVVSPTGSQAASSKKRGRPKLSEEKDTASWSDAMVEGLLAAARVANNGGKNEVIVEVGQDIKDGLVIMSDLIASALTIPQP